MKKKNLALKYPFNVCAMAVCMYLRVSLEVSLVKRLEVALVRAWGSGLAS